MFRETSTNRRTGSINGRGLIGPFDFGVHEDNFLDTDVKYVSILIRWPFTEYEAEQCKFLSINQTFSIGLRNGIICLTSDVDWGGSIDFYELTVIILTFVKGC